MTYMALARKWRPKQFSDVVGQSHVVQALSNALNSGRVHHAYLFTGTRGVGKTTLARILAKSLNCETGMSAEPCQQCSVCVSVDQGNYVDLIEVDAASRTGIDDMRELLDNVQYAPTSGHFKVYLIDEVHMLSKSSFNALLKTLEEPPEHVKFLFATTDPQKLPVTVLSRCLQFNLQALQPNQIGEQITKILDSENIQYSPVAIDSGDVQEDGVRAMLGTLKSKHLDALLNALISNEAEALLQTVQEMAMYSIDFQAALDQLLLDLHHISLAHLAEGALANKVDDVQKYQEYAKRISVEDVQLLYQIALISKRDLPLAPDHRSGFEMAMMRMLAFKPNSQPVENIVSKSVIIEDQSKSQDVSPAETTTDTSVVTEKTIERVDPQVGTTEQGLSRKEAASELEKTSVQVAKDEPVVNQENYRRSETNQQIQTTTNQAESFTAQEPLTSKPLATETKVSDKSVSPSMTDNTSGTPLLGAAVEPSIKQRSQVNELEKTQITPQERVEPSFSENSKQWVQPRPDNNHEAVESPNVVTNAHSLRSEPTIERDTSLTNSPPSSSASTTPPVTPRTIESNGKKSRLEPSFGEQAQQPQPAPQPTPQQAVQRPAEIPQANNNDSDEVEVQVRPASASSWAGMLERLNLNGLIKELAMNMACDDIGADPMVFHLSPTWSFLHNQPREDSIVKEIHKVRGDNCAVKLVFEDTVSETPAERLARLKEERMQQTKTDLSDDKGVQDLMNTFELSMNESSIKPTNENN